MYPMFIAMPIMMALLLIVFLFKKRAVLFSSSARKTGYIPPKRQTQDLSMRRLLMYLIPEEKQPEIKKIFADYSSKTYLEFKRAYRDLTEDVELEVEDFSQDIRGSLLVMWMKKENMLYLWGSEADNEAVCTFLENKTGITLSEGTGKKEKLQKEWANELRQQGYALLIIRDSFEGDPVVPVPCATAECIAGKQISDIRVLSV